MCFDGEDGLVFFVFEVTSDDMLVDVDNGFHGLSCVGLSWAYVETGFHG